MKNKIWKIEFDLDWGTRHPRRYIEIYYEKKNKPTNEEIYSLYVRLIQTINKKRKKEERELWNITEYSKKFITTYFTVTKIKTSNDKINYQIVTK